jgi:hypothetical protein
MQNKQPVAVALQIAACTTATDEAKVSASPRKISAVLRANVDSSSDAHCRARTDVLCEHSLIGVG